MSEIYSADLIKRKPMLDIQFKLWCGVMRRFFIFIFHKKYIEDMLKFRSGKCARCGACCKLISRKCPYLELNSEGMYSCKIHKSFRMPNCIIFPVDYRDIEDRNLVTCKPCGYKFMDSAEKQSLGK